MADTAKALSTSVKVGTLIMRDTGKNTNCGVKTNVTIARNTGKNVAVNTKVSVSVLRAISKHLNTSVRVAPLVLHAIGKNINANVKLTGAILKNTATLTMAYNGNAELGLGAEEGAQFDIIVTGTFTTFTISMNGKSLTYTENCIDQTITIDNVNATVKNGTTNKLSKVTGDVADFLKLIPGDNVITYEKTGSSTDFVFDFSPIFI